MAANGQGLKVAAQMSAEPSPEEFAFNRQMGMEYAVAWADGPNVLGAYYQHYSDLFKENGITLTVFGRRSILVVDRRCPALFFVGVPIALSQPQGKLSWLTRADRFAVQLGDRHHASGGAGDEYLLGV